MADKKKLVSELTPEEHELRKEKNRQRNAARRAREAQIREEREATQNLVLDSDKLVFRSRFHRESLPRFVVAEQVTTTEVMWDNLFEENRVLLPGDYKVCIMALEGGQSTIFKSHKEVFENVYERYVPVESEALR